MLNRIKAIQELKNKYSLEELAKILSPEVAKRNFTTDDLAIIEEIKANLIPAFVKVFNKNNFRYIEVLLMIAISDFKDELDLSISQIIDLTNGIKDYSEKIKSTGYMFVIFNNNNEYLGAIYKAQAEIFVDKRVSIVKNINLDDISSNIKLKYRKSFNFKFDDEVEQNSEIKNMVYSYQA